MVFSTIEPGPPFLNHKLKYKIRWRLGKLMFFYAVKKTYKKFDDHVATEDTYVPFN